jgi:hypothetical protein
MRGPVIRKPRPKLKKLAPGPAEWPRSFHLTADPVEEFGYYGAAFLSAARVLRRSIDRRRGIRNGDILPPIYLYRHAIEVLTKAVLLSGNDLRAFYGDEGETEEAIFNQFRSWRHRLTPMLVPMKRTFNAVHWIWNCPGTKVETFKDVGLLFADLDALDPNSSAFRYPVNLKGERSISISHSIGLKTTLSALDDLAEALDTTVFAFDTMCSELGSLP